MSLATEKIDRVNNYTTETTQERIASEENRLNAILKTKKMLEDKKITLEVYADFISKNENFKNKIKEVEEFIENIEAIIGYFQPTKFDVREIKPEIKKFISDYETFFKENENNIKESALMKFEKYIEEIKEMEKLLEI